MIIYKIIQEFDQITSIQELKIKARTILLFIFSIHIFVFANEPPSVPIPPQGPTTAYYEELYNFRTYSADPEEDSLFYQFDRGNTTYSLWKGPFASGEYVTFEYSWGFPGEYQIRARAKDVHGNISEWSQPATVNIIKMTGNFISQEPSGSFVRIYDNEQKTFKVSIKNTGSITWDHNTLLATKAPENRHSEFSHETWIRNNRPARVETPTPPDQAYTFEFIMRPPAISVDSQTFEEHFTLIQENHGWFQNYLDIWWRINVIKSSDSEIPVNIHTGSNVYSQNKLINLNFPVGCYSKDFHFRIMETSSGPDSIIFEILCDSVEQLNFPGILNYNLQNSQLVDQESAALAFYSEDQRSTIGGTYLSETRTLTASFKNFGKYVIYSGVPQTTNLSNEKELQIKCQPRVFKPNGPPLNIIVHLNNSSRIDLRAYNLNGKLIRVISQNSPLHRGDNILYWDGRDQDQHRVSDGLYIIAAQNGSTFKKITVSIISGL